MDTAEGILAGLGGKENILKFEPCITRLRVDVVNPEQVDEALLEAAGAFGVVRFGTSVQVVVGPQADDLADLIEKLIN